MVKALWNRYRDSYAGLPRAAWILAGVQLVNTSGSMVIFFMTLYLSRHLGFSVAQAGLVMSVYGVGMLMGTFTGGALSDRLGAFTVQRLSLLGSTVMLVGLSFLHAYAWILAGTVLWGLFSSALFPANATAMAALCPEEVRARGFVLNRLANNLGATIGPVVGGFLAHHDYRLLFWVDGATCFLALLALWWLFPAGHPDVEPTSSSPEVRTAWWRDGIFGLVLVSTLGVALVFSQLFSTFGPYLREAHGLLESRIGALIAVNTAMIVVLQMPLTHWTERFPRLRVASFGGVLLGLGFGLMPLGSGMAYLAATVALWTLGEMLTLPSLTTLVSLRAPAQAQGRYQGLFSLAFSMGITLGPFLGARLYQAAGGGVLWISVAGLAWLAAGVLLGLSRMWDGRPISSAQA